MRFRKLLCRSQTRINLLFTMSEITHVTVHPDNACEVMFRGRYSWGRQPARLRSFELRRGSLRYDPARLAVAGISQRRLVEPDGIEPTTSCLQSTRSPS
jgi:hypothetical protein